MDFLDKFFENIDWNAQPYDGDRPFLNSSVEFAKKYSYAWQLMNDDLALEARYTEKDLVAEKNIIEKLKTPRLRHPNFTNDEQKSDQCNIDILVNFPKNSRLSVTEVKFYKKLLNLFQRGLLKGEEVQEFEKFNKLLETERLEYQSFAKNEWIKENYKRHYMIVPDVKKFIDEHWQSRLERINQYPPFYKRVAVIPLIYNMGADNESNEINMLPGKILMKLGTPANYVFIPMHLNPGLFANYDEMVKDNPVDQAYLYPSVSQDQVAEDLAKLNNVQVVLSSSSLKCLLDNQCSNLTATWSLPITIKEYKSEKGVKKVVFIDKRLPPKTLSNVERIQWFSKISIRRLFSQHSDDISYNDTSQFEPSGSLNKSTFNSSLETVDSVNSDSEDLVIDDLILNKESGNKAVMEEGDGNRIKPGKRKCYVYQYWKLGKQNVNQLMKSDGEIIPIIIRRRHDVVNKNGNKNLRMNNGVDHQEVRDKLEIKSSVILAPKLEYQFELGAESINKSECIRQWVDSFIRPGSSLYRVRLNPISGKVIQIERTDKYQLKLDSQKRHINLSKIWSSLYSVLSKLILMPAGEYLLDHSQKYGTFCKLFTTTDKPCVDFVNLLKDYRVNVEDVAPISAPWIPLDENILTPICRSKNMLSVMFPPRYNVHREVGVIGKRKGKGKKKKNKKKNKDVSKSNIVS